MEGLLAGIVGSTLPLLHIPMIFLANWKLFAIIALAGFLGNLVDSILGATLQHRGALSNHDVNFWATASGALFSLAASISF
jgi:uncharacterized membrane protein